MAIRDGAIAWARQRLWVPYMSFSGYVEATDTFQSDDTGNPIPASVNSGLAGLLMASGNGVVHAMPFPSFFDIEHDIGVRIRWIVVGTVAVSDTVVWAFTYNQSDTEESHSDPITALNTTIATQSPLVTTTLIHYRSPRGIINANTFDEAAIDGMLAFRIQPTLTGFEATEVHLLGVEFDYYPKMTLGGVNDTVESRQ